MPNLSEQVVQQTALQYLRKKYKHRCLGRSMYWQAEVRTRKRYGSKRADALLAFRHWLWGTYVVSMEAKSMKTLPAIRPRHDPFRFLFNCTKAGAAGVLLSGAYLALLKTEDGLLQFSLIFNVWVAFAFGFALLTFNSFRHRSLKVIQQLRQYPANEQWLALSKDCLQRLEAKKRAYLIAICKREGIGIVLVKPGRKAKTLVRPRRRWHWRGDFLRFYSKEKQIRQQIS